ncbi:MAG: Lrp/AsnC ligand binding domain-containing protein [Euryarchaeota archaeon]|nr:Lrp/AsnC ligand binding domain-containing protein [Euryarchaeota archaeon]
MVVGATLINVAPGKERPVYQVLKTIRNIREILHLFGEYDFLTIIEAEGLKALNDIVDQIRNIPGVTSTKTMLAAEL